MEINGKDIAQEILSALKKREPITKFLGAVLAGDNAASISFLKQKEKAAAELGIQFRLYKFSEDIEEPVLAREILKITQDMSCGGLIVQLPLPPHINRSNILKIIPGDKDLDATGEEAKLLPPAVLVVQEIFRRQKFEPKDKIVAVMGQGFLVGRPIARWLQDGAGELILLDKGDDLARLKNADCTICGTGEAGLINGSYIKEDALVIDFGYGLRDGKISGDLDINKLPETVKFTPTPGGTGPILVAKLFENFFKLNSE